MNYAIYRKWCIYYEINIRNIVLHFQFIKSFFFLHHNFEKYSIYQLCIICLMIHKMNPTKSNNGSVTTVRKRRVPCASSHYEIESLPLPARKSRPRTEKGSLENEFDPHHFFFVSTRTFFFLSRSSLDHLIESQYSKCFYSIDKIVFNI